MRMVIQRVKSANVVVGQETVGNIEKGALIFLAVGKNDSENDANYLVEKVAQLRIDSIRRGPGLFLEIVS